MHDKKKKTRGQKALRWHSLPAYADCWAEDSKFLVSDSGVVRAAGFECLHSLLQVLMRPSQRLFLISHIGTENWSWWSSFHLLKIVPCHGTSIARQIRTCTSCQVRSCISQHLLQNFLMIRRWWCWGVGAPVSAGWGCYWRACQCSRNSDHACWRSKSPLHVITPSAASGDHCCSRWQLLFFFLVGWLESVHASSNLRQIRLWLLLATCGLHLVQSRLCNWHLVAGVAASNHAVIVGGLSISSRVFNFLLTRR